LQQEGSFDHPEQRLLEKIQKIRNALDDDAIFDVVGDLIPVVHVERLLRKVDAEHFRAICQNALEGLATKRLKLEMLIERRASAQERWLVPETIVRFLQEAAPYVPMSLKPVPSLKHTFEASRTPRSYDAMKPTRLEVSTAGGPLSAPVDRPRRGRPAPVGVGHPWAPAL
jgi:hypothetical protein